MKLFHLQQLQLSNHPNLFEKIDWEFQVGECWTVYGKSGSGKTLLKNILSGHVPITQHGHDHQSISDEMTIVEMSPDQERQLLEREKKEDDSEFTEGGYDPGRSALEIISEHAHKDFNNLETWIKKLQLLDHLKTSFKTLSNGETRKVLLLRAIAQKPDLLLMDSPFEGLDENTRKLLHSVLEDLKGKQSSIIFVQRISDICKVSDALLQLNPPHAPLKTSIEDCRLQQDHQNINIPEEIKQLPQLKKADPLIQIRQLNIRYGERTIFKNFDWKMSAGENWLFTGPNGAGKTTLLQLIHADHPQSYGQDLKLFGYQRGQGESIWDIKAHIGFVSADFQRHFPLSMTGLAMVISGFYDSMGVYQKPSDQQLHLAKLWLQCLNIDRPGSSYLSQLSWGEIRQLMIVRALVKKPNLLILDEPCQGLDDDQKQVVLDLIERCSQLFEINLIYVSHYRDEKLACLTHHLEWKTDEQQQYTHQIHALK